MIAHNSKPMAYGYGRISKGIDVQALSRDWQEATITDYFTYKLKPLGVPFAGFWFDPATSGKSTFFTRKAGCDLNNKLKVGDHLIIAKLDRAFRSPGDGHLTLDNMRQRGIVCHILDLNVDTSSIMGEAMLGMMLIISRWERRTIAERTKSALDVKGKHNLPRGGANAPAGWRKIGLKDKSHWVIDLKEREICLRIVQEMKAGMWSRVIARRLTEEGITWRGKEIDHNKARYLAWHCRRGFPLPTGGSEAGVIIGQPAKDRESFG